MALARATRFRRGRPRSARSARLRRPNGSTLSHGNRHLQNPLRHVCLGRSSHKCVDVSSTAIASVQTFASPAPCVHCARQSNRGTFGVASTNRSTEPSVPTPEPSPALTYLSMRLPLYLLIYFYSRLRRQDLQRLASSRVETLGPTIESTATPSSSQTHCCLQSHREGSHKTQTRW